MTTQPKQKWLDKHDNVAARDLLLWALAEIGAKIEGDAVGCPFHGEPGRADLDGSIRADKDGNWLYDCKTGCKWNQEGDGSSTGTAQDVLWWAIHRYTDPNSSRLMVEVERIISELWGCPSNPRIRWWREEFWEWNGYCYRPTLDKELCARTLHWLGNWADTASPPWANKITKGLQATVLVRSEVEQPIWINEDGSTNARRLIAMQNGLLDLDALLAGESAVLKENTPRWFSSVGLDYQFDAQGTCPRWLAFLDRCLASNQELIALLQEWFGYCLTHDTSQQKAMFFEGDGANGKSVAVLTLEQVVGKANTSNVPLEVFGQRFQLTSTLGKLVNICGDTGELDKVAEGFIKQFTGGDTMYFDRKHISSIKAKPTARLLVVTNNRPRFSDRSGGIWRRIILMPWRVTIPEKDQDKRLVCPDSHDWPFREELSGIFNWAVEGLRRLRKRGRFEVPASCREAVEEYRLECNPAREFLNECCEAKPGQRVQVTELYKHYEGWCKTRGYRALGLAAFGKEVGRCFPAAKKTRPTISGKRVSCYEGLAMEDGGS